MKKTLTLLILATALTAAFAQGTVDFENTGTTKFQTNSVAIGGTSGVIVEAPGSFYYELLTAPSTVTTVDASLQQLLTATWSDTGLEATNTNAHGYIFGGDPVVANFWLPGTTNSFIIVGWSSNLGSTWVQVAAELSLAEFFGSGWCGGSLPSGGFLGATTVGFGESGGGFLTPLGLFGSGPNGRGNPITTPTTLWVVATIPEPSSFALAGLGAAALCHLRRRKECCTV